MTSLTNALTAKSGININIQNAEERLFREVTDGSRRPFMIPSITTVNERNQTWWQTWAAGESWTTYHNYLTGAGSSADSERAFWFSLGTNNRQNTVGYSSMSFDNNNLIYAKNSQVGNDDVHIAHQRNNSYGPFRLRTMFLRNHHPTTAQSVSMWGYYTNYWAGAGTDGSGVCVGYPNANGSYNNVTDINWSVPVNRTGGNSYYTWGWSMTIPARTTISVTQTSSMFYWQSGYVSWYLDGNMFYDLHSTFSNFWVQPDLEMTYAAHTYNDQLNEFNVRNSWRIWRRTAELFGDR